MNEPKTQREIELTNSAFGSPKNKNKSPKNYARIAKLARNGNGPRG